MMSLIINANTRLNTGLDLHPQVVDSMVSLHPHEFHHHQAAVDMARVQLLDGKDPQMRRLAQEIIADQHLEIEHRRLPG
jgi:uncharacterized protein (DUF305 family)